MQNLINMALRMMLRAPGMLVGALIMAFVMNAQLALVVLVKSLLKAPLLAAFGGHEAAHAVRYFIMVLVAGAAWPLTFRFFERYARL